MSRLNGPLVLPTDLLIVPVQELGDAVRSAVGNPADGYVLTRPRARRPSQLVNASAHSLLKLFSSPTTIVDAVIRFSRDRELDAEETLRSAFPLLEKLVIEELLLTASQTAISGEPTLHLEEDVAGFRIVRCLQVMNDTEVYQVQRSGVLGMVKIAQPQARSNVTSRIIREARILEHLAGEIGPEPYGAGVWRGRAYFVAMGGGN